jgi:alanine racemase
MKLTLAEVAEACGGTLEQGDPDRLLRDVATDTRQPIPEGALFVALRGDNFDGHAFVEEALEAGAAAAMVEAGDGSERSDRGIVRVDDTLEGLQRLAADWRSRFDYPVVGVTGSNGKTIVKEMLAGILSREKTVYRSPASYNSQVGVPLSLLGLNRDHEIAVIEAGISRVGEMETLERMIRPDVGVITNIGLAHAAGLETLETTAREKLKLFAGFDDEPLIYPVESESLRARDLPGRPVGYRGTLDGPDRSIASYELLDREHGDGGFGFEVRSPDGRRRVFALHVPGEHNVQNAVCTLATACELGTSWEAIREGLSSFELGPMRLEMHTTPSGVTLLNDAYSSDPVSARAALSALDQYAADHRRIAILGDMLDLGDHAEEAHRELGIVCANLELDRLICFGERAHWIGESAVQHGMEPTAISHLEEMEALVERLDEKLQSGDVVLFKGSRRLELDRAAEALLESVAPTRLYVDLDRIRINYHALGRHVGDDTGFMAVVKSFGYGNDSTRVAQTLVREGVDALAVAYPDEGMPLRERGLTLPILVTNVLPEEADKIAEYDLTAQVYTRRVVEALAEEAERRGCEVSVHLMVETGMNRVGLPPDEVVEFARWVEGRSGVDYRGVMTHFAAADVPGEEDYTRSQLETFQSVLSELESADLSPETVHAANTAAAWRFPEAHFDMVRVGLGLYGLAPSGAVYETGDMAPALRLTTRIVHVKRVEPGETVGYGRTWRAERETRVATIAAGYNDGLPRFMSNGGEVLIGGERCPIVGSVCMDVAMVDVTDVPEAEVGDEVVIFGEQGGARITVDEIAERGDTINYEILCNVSPRVRRIFVRESE